MKSVRGAALAERWEGSEGQNRVEAALRALRHGVSLASVGIGQWNGRWDLRGVTVPGAHNREEIKQRIQEGRAGPGHRNWRTELKGAKLVGLDLSYTNLSESNLESCLIEDSLLDNAVLGNTRLVSCIFRQTSMQHADLRSSFFPAWPNRPPNVFEQVNFDRADLRGSHHIRSNFVDCSFRSAKLTRVNFEASNFARCVFAGPLNSVWFRGGYAVPEDEKRYGRAEPSGMEGVDFSVATLHGVMFTQGIDLTKAILPSESDHVIIRDPDSAYHHARRVIGLNWPEPDRSIGLEIVHFLERTDRQGLPIDIENRQDVAKSIRTSRMVVGRDLGIGDGATLQGKDPDTEDTRLAAALAELLETPAESRDRTEPAPESSLWPTAPKSRSGVDVGVEDDRSPTRWWWPFRRS